MWGKSFIHRKIQYFHSLGFIFHRDLKECGQDKLRLVTTNFTMYTKILWAIVNRGELKVGVIVGLTDN